jgi:5,10-methylene-tetrahydrofolate dehydrogenase/methenyl tetrahydrofolate cyclohydrolase
MQNKFAVLVLALLVGGCNVTVREDWQIVNRQTEIIAAQTRRAQLIVEQERLERLLRRTVVIDDRAVIQSQINRARFEVEQLNSIIDR